MTSLAHAVAIQSVEGPFDEDDVLNIYNVIEKCGSFVEIESPWTVWLAARMTHLSMTEYLHSEHLAQSGLKGFHLTAKSAHLELALACLRYISTDEVFQYAPKVERSTWFFKKYSFYEYAAQHWYEHLRLSSVDEHQYHEEVRPHITWFLLPDAHSTAYKTWQGHSEMTLPLPPLHYGIAYGLFHAVTDIVVPLEGLDLFIEAGETPLTLAVTHGRLDIARLLLDRGASIDLACDPYTRKGLTALHIAAELPDVPMVDLLLTIGARHGVQSTSEITPFYRAARSGSVEIMRKLKDAGAGINAKSYDDFTPLIEAVEQEMLSALEVLLAWGADPFVETSQGDTALSYVRWHARNPAILKIVRTAYLAAQRQMHKDDELPEPRSIAFNRMRSEWNTKNVICVHQDPSGSDDPITSWRINTASHCDDIE